MCITIPLKNSQSGKKTVLDEEFIKVIEYEYAVRYLEHLGINPTANNIAVLLKKHPLSSCELNSGWNNSGQLADILYIFPHKTGKKTFDDNRDEMGYSNADLAKKKEKISNLTSEQ
jgi:hypothetical protein